MESNHIPTVELEISKAQYGVTTVVTAGRKISSSTIHCPDGAVLAVTLSEGRSQSSDCEIRLIEFMDENLNHYQTWMDERAASVARVGKILYAAKHSPEFRESLKVEQVEYPKSQRLVTLLGQLDKPGFIEVSGNREPATAHQEAATVINFPDGFPKNLEKHARRAGWISVRKGGGHNRIKVCANYGNAHVYNLRFEQFLERMLTNGLKRPDYFYLDLPSASTVPATFGVKRPVTAIAPEVVSKAVEAAICYPLRQAHDALRRLKAGRDAWSSMKSQELESHIEPGALDLLQKAFKGEKSRLTAYRWHLRGLPAPYAILKATLEIERAQDYAMINR